MILMLAFCNTDSEFQMEKTDVTTRVCLKYIVNDCNLLMKLLNFKLKN